MAEDTLVASDSRKAPFIWLDVELDDLGLDPYEFRILARIIRRAGSNSTCFESIQSIAEAALISRCKVISTIKKLEQKNIISVVRSVGADGAKKSNRVTVKDKSAWLPSKTTGGGSLPQRLGVVSDVDEGSLPRRHELDPPEEDPSKELKEDTLPSSEKKIVPIDPKIKELAVKWEAWVKQRHKGIAKSIKLYAQPLADVARKAELTPEQLTETFQFIKSDEEFWAKNAISPATLLEKSKKNSLRKIDNIRLQMDTSGKKTPHKEQVSTYKSGDNSGFENEPTY